MSNLNKAISVLLSLVMLLGSFPAAIGEEGAAVQEPAPVVEPVKEDKPEQEVPAEKTVSVETAVETEQEAPDDTKEEAQTVPAAAEEPSEAGDASVSDNTAASDVQEVTENAEQTSDAELPGELSSEETADGEQMTEQAEELPSEEATQILFSEGYATLSKDTIIYKDIECTEKSLKTGSAYVCYVVSRKVFEDGSQDVLKIVYAVEGNAQNGYIHASAANELNEDAVRAYIAGADISVRWNDKVLENVQVEGASGAESGEVSDEPVPEASAETEPETDTDAAPVPDAEPDIVSVENTDESAEDVGPLVLASSTGETTLVYGKNLQLIATKIDEEKPISYSELKWESSNENAAVVSSTGMVTAKLVEKPMNTVITASTFDGAMSASVTLRVDPVHTGIQIIDGAGNTVSNGSTVVLESGVSEPVNYTVVALPQYVPAEIVCNVEGDPVATVIKEQDKSFTVTGTGIGNCKVVFSTEDGSVSAYLNIRVQRSVTAIDSSETTIYVGKKKSVSLAGYIRLSPEDASCNSFSYSTANKKIATVSASGVVKGVGVGTTKITVTAKDGSGVSGVFTVKTVYPVTKVTVAKSSDEIAFKEGMSYVVKGAVAPAANSACLVIESNNPEVATPKTGKYNGTVGGFEVDIHDYGTAVLTIRATDGSGKKASMTLKVVRPPEAIEVHAKAAADETIKEWPLGPAAKVQLQAVVKGDAPYTSQTVKWKTSNTSLATVTSSGLVAAKKVYLTSNVTVTAYSAVDDSVLGTYLIKIAPYAQSLYIADQNGVKITKHEFDLDTYDSSEDALGLQVKVTPVQANSKVDLFTWSSSNESIAKLVNGFVIPVGPGTAKITATARDGSKKSASVTITVHQATTALTGINVPNAAGIVGVGKSLTLTAARIPEKSNSTLEWSCSPAGYVSVSNGVVKGLKATGDTPVTVTAKVAGTNIETSVELYVEAPIPGLRFTCDDDGIIDLSNNETTTHLNLLRTDGLDIDCNTIIWKSSDTEIAEVNDSGVVTATKIKTGSVKITASATDGSGKVASYTVKVMYGINELVDVPTDIYVAKGKSITINPTLDPQNATAGITYTSSNAKVAKVSRNTVTGKKVGTAKITVIPEAGSLAERKTVTVHVTTPSKSVDLYVNGVKTANRATHYLYDINDTLTMKASVAPAGSYQKVIWTSSDESVAAVDENGIVTAHSDGTATITATTTDKVGRNASITLKVGKPVESLLVSGIHSVVVKKSITLKAYVLPVSAVNKSVTWSSSNAAIAKVSASGVVTGVKNGTVTIRAKAAGKNGEALVYDFVVHVVPRATGVGIYKSGEYVTNTTQYIDLRWNTPIVQLTAMVNSTGAEQLVSWSSSNKAIASVNADGVVTGLKPGTVTIKATTADGSKKYASVKVTVVDEGFDLKINGETDVLIPGATEQLTVKGQNSYCGEHEIEANWSSSDPSVATVDENGKVTAVAEGKAVISADSIVISSTKATYEITVRPQLKSFEATGSDRAIDLNNENESTLQLGYAPDPANAECSVRWSSADNDIATVDPNTGAVTGHKVGEVEITAQLLDGSDMKATVKVIVKAYIQSITIENNGYDMLYAGESTKLSAMVAPQTEGTADQVSWTTEDAGYITVAQDGTVTVVNSLNGAATVTVTATAKDDKAVSETYELRVTTVSAEGILYETTSDGVVIKGYKGEGGSVRIPETIDGSAVKAIATGAFLSGCHQITAISFPQNVVFEKNSVNGLAHLFSDEYIIFNGVLCKYTGIGTAITIPASVTKVGAGAFEDNTTLEEVTIPNSVTSFEESAFSGCSNLHKMSTY